MISQTVLDSHNRLTKSQMFSPVSVVRLKEIALPPSEEIAGYEPKDQAAKVSLPCYVWEKGDYDEPPDYC